MKTGKPKVEWTEVGTEIDRRTVFMQVYGLTNTGRTSLALTAPGPIALIHASEKLEGVAQAAVRAGKKVRQISFGRALRGSHDDIIKQATVKVDAMSAAWYDALGWARTIILDTHTEAWEMMRMAEFGTTTPKGVVKALYGPLNSKWRSLFKAFRDQDRCHIVAIGQAKEKYVNDKPTGKYEQAGQREMRFLADVILRTGRGKDGSFTAKVEKGWWNAHSEGLELENEDIRFSYLMSLITDTEEEEWT